MPGAERQRAKELAEINAASFIINSANNIFGKELVATVPERAISRPRIPGFPLRQIPNSETAIRVKFGKGLVNFMELTGWHTDNPALRYIAARLYLSYIDNSLADSNLFSEETGRASLQEIRTCMQTALDRWRAEQLTEADREEVDDWYIFFVGTSVNRNDVMLLFRQEGRDTVLDLLRKRRQKQIATDTQTGLQTAPSREALLEQLKRGQRGSKRRR